MVAHKQTQYQSQPSSTETKHQEVKCFFCGEAPGIHETVTFQLVMSVKLCALIQDDMGPLTQLNSGDMLSQEAKYQQNYLMNLYNSARKIKEMVDTEDLHSIAELAFTELVVFIEAAHMDDETSPFFKFAELVQLYKDGTA